jgi:hypothetical protein
VTRQHRWLLGSSVALLAVLAGTAVLCVQHVRPVSYRGRMEIPARNVALRFGAPLMNGQRALEWYKPGEYIHSCDFDSWGSAPCEIFGVTVTRHWGFYFVTW